MTASGALDKRTRTVVLKNRRESSKKEGGVLCFVDYNTKYPSLSAVRIRNKSEQSRLTPITVILPAELDCRRRTLSPKMSVPFHLGGGFGGLELTCPPSRRGIESEVYEFKQLSI
ncbi:hypothetical protein K2173_014924 [Erythroxylum novogranatense]|uniref:Uncharacterized protein n=1 Tax=Erythroxylum novogranatense TaxID=1862640 RepID=A0AAV8TFZ5_9ROSI|nr:hypothetical protein K2173_014924 [Erythroxylum novogranatense]